MEHDMKKLILIFALLFSSVAYSQMHGALSFEGGNVVIQKGTRAPEVIKHMGRPLYIDYQTYCTRSTREGRCLDWGNREIWFYEHRRTDYELTIIGGVVRNIKWGGYR